MRLLVMGSKQTVVLLCVYGIVRLQRDCQQSMTKNLMRSSKWVSAVKHLGCTSQDSCFLSTVQYLCRKLSHFFLQYMPSLKEVKVLHNARIRGNAEKTSDYILLQWRLQTIHCCIHRVVCNDLAMAQKRDQLLKDAILNGKSWRKKKNNESFLLEDYMQKCIQSTIVRPRREQSHSMP